MSNQNYIKRAVELAKHWWGAGTEAFGPSNFHRPYASLKVDSPDTRFFLDALAAQLVRQIDALDTPHTIQVSHNRVWSGYRSKSAETWKITQGPDRAMNTIKAIVNSSVLTAGEGNEFGEMFHSDGETLLVESEAAGDHGSKSKMCNFQGCEHTMDCAVHRNERCDCGQTVPNQDRQ